MFEPLLVGLYTAEQMRAVDAAAIKGLKIPGGHLMERAGAAVAREILRGFDPEAVAVYAGKGNNGGDGFVVARELFNAGVDVTVYTTAPAAEYKGDAKLNLGIAKRLGVEIVYGIETDEDADVVVDAVFGTGFSGVAEGAAAEAIEAINDSAAAIVALDIPSGVDASTGEIAGPAVDADLTITLHAPKVGHFVAPGAWHTGHTLVVPIGIPPVCDVEPDVYAVTKLGAALLVRPKTERDHKRSVGTVLVLGGSAGMAGAAHMAAMGALRSGAGLVHCALPAGETRDKPFLEVITVPLPDKAAIGPASLAAARAEMKAMKATALGPGMGRDEQSVTFARQIVAEKVPLVIDADGLYALGTDLDLLIERKAPTVLTPHEGELARLLDTTVAEVSARRLAAARQAAALSGATVLLKGSLTIVADPSGRAYVVATGNPGLATPGTGDVLTGCIVAQLAKGLDASDAACLGAYIHGLAADLAVEQAVGVDGLIAGDLFDFLPLALESLTEGDDEHDHDHDHGE